MGQLRLKKQGRVTFPSRKTVQVTVPCSRRVFSAMDARLPVLATSALHHVHHCLC